MFSLLAKERANEKRGFSSQRKDQLASKEYLSIWPKSLKRYWRDTPAQLWLHNPEEEKQLKWGSSFFIPHLYLGWPQGYQIPDTFHTSGLGEFGNLRSISQSGRLKFRIVCLMLMSLLGIVVPWSCDILRGHQLTNQNFVAATLDARYSQTWQ